MTPTMAQILADTKRFTQQKIAEITGKDPSTIPGAEHDSAVPDEFTRPDPLVADPSVGPASARSNTGAGGSPVPNDETLEADEAVLEPEKKPLITADANAKTASLANEILGLIRQTQTQAPVQKQAEIAAPAPAQTTVKDKSAAIKSALEAKLSTKKKASQEPDLELTTDIMAKMAMVMLSTEEGAEAMEYYLQKEAGAEFARETLGFLVEQAELAEKQAQYDQGAADAEAAMAGMGGAPGAEAAIDDMAGMPEDNSDITEEDVIEALEGMVADGTIQPEDAQQILDEIVNGDAEGVEGAEGVDPTDVDVEKVASYSQGAQDAEGLLLSLYKQGEDDVEAALEAAGEGAGADEDALDGVDITEEDVAQALAELVEDGTLSEEDVAQLVSELDEGEEGLGDDDVTEEDVAQALAELVEEGTLSEEDVADIVADLAGE